MPAPNRTSGGHDISMILSKIKEGYYVIFDRKENKFNWITGETRSIIDLNPQNVQKSEKMIKKITENFEVFENKNTEEVLKHFSDERIKPNSWIQGEVLEIYKLLEQEGYLVTIEAYLSNKLAGAILAIDLGGVIMGETMFSIVPSASKVCLNYTIRKYFDKGYPFIDVFTVHPPNHPIGRLERTISMEEYLPLLERTLQLWRDKKK